MPRLVVHSSILVLYTRLGHQGRPQEIPDIDPIQARGQAGGHRVTRRLQYMRLWVLSGTYPTRTCRALPRQWSRARSRLPPASRQAYPAPPHRPTPTGLEHVSQSYSRGLSPHRLPPPPHAIRRPVGGSALRPPTQLGRSFGGPATAPPRNSGASSASSSPRAATPPRGVPVTPPAGNGAQPGAAAQAGYNEGTAQWPRGRTGAGGHL